MGTAMKSGTSKLLVGCLAAGALCLFVPILVESAEDIEATSQLRLAVRTESRHFKVGEPIAFMGSIDNVTKADVYFYRLESSGTVMFEIFGVILECCGWVSW